MLQIDRPRDADVHTFADFAELLCLVTTDRVCTRETITDQIRDVGDHTVSDSQLDDCFLQLKWRTAAYGVHYPFQLDALSRVLSAPEVLTPDQKLYALLLICANLAFIEKSTGTLTDAFERVALQALKMAWPTSGATIAFGKNESEFTGPKWQRINKLAELIGGTGLCDESTFRGRDSGDGGIDLAAWLELDSHERRNIPSALAQCACSRDQWSRKQTEISEDRIGTQLSPTHRWMQILLIPQSFRNNSGGWAVSGDIGKTILMDRLRIIHQLGSNADWLKIDPPQLFEEVLTHRLPLV